MQPGVLTEASGHMKKPSFEIHTVGHLPASSFISQCLLSKYFLKNGRGKKLLVQVMTLFLPTML